MKSVFSEVASVGLLGTSCQYERVEFRPPTQPLLVWVAVDYGVFCGVWSRVVFSKSFLSC